MLIMLSIVTLLGCCVINFTNTITYTSLDNRFYSCLKSSLENSISYQGDKIYFNKFLVKENLEHLLSKNINNITKDYELYIDYYYSDMRACNYQCKNVKVRLYVDVSFTLKYDKSYEMRLVSNHE